jgi:hypothetical protein
MCYDFRSLVPKLVSSKHILVVLWPVESSWVEVRASISNISSENRTGLNKFHDTSYLLF